MTKEQKVYWRKYKDDHGITWEKLTEVINAELGTNYTNVRDMLKRVRIEQRPTLVIGDIHFPFEHPHYLKFLSDVDKKYKCDQLKVCVGDMVDNHAISRHTSSHQAMGARDEYYLTYQKVQELSNMFPNMLYCLGNHCTISQRQAQTIGLADVFLKDFNALWGLPSTWDVKTSHIHNEVLYKHGINCGGVNGARLTAIREGMSTVIGHLHAMGGVSYMANNRRMLFGANAGCGIDVDAYAFEYGKEAKDKPTLGCVVVFSKDHATFVPMDIEYYNEKYGR